MGLADIKDQITERLIALKDQIDENPHINTIKEKYQTLPARTQKVLTIALCCFAFFILMYIPYSYISSSSQNIADFDKNRNLIREMFKYSQNPKGSLQLPTTSNSSALISQVRSSINRFELLPDQILGIEETDLKTTGKPLAKKPIIQTAVSAKFKQLNVKQIVDLSFHFKTLKDHIKLISTDIKEDPNKEQYFNVDFRLVSYAYPVKKIPTEKSSKKNKKKKKTKRKTKNKRQQKKG